MLKLCVGSAGRNKYIITFNSPLYTFLSVVMGKLTYVPCMVFLLDNTGLDLTFYR